MSATTRTLGSIITDARARCEQEAARGWEWTFFHMTESEREMFDHWLVKINHVLAHEPGTVERRFKRFIADLVSGRYRGELP